MNPIFLPWCLQLRHDVRCGIPAERSEQWCQTDANQTPLGTRGCPLCRTKTAPLGKRSGSGELEIWAFVEMALRVDVVVD